MFCKNCGNQVDDNAVICTKCGCLTDKGEAFQKSVQHPEQNLNAVAKKEDTNDTLCLAAKILMIISCVIMGIYIVTLCWTIPMTVSFCKKIKNKQEISTGFKICILLFVNTVAGILLLCMKNESN